MYDAIATILPLAKVGEAIMSLLELDKGMSLQAASALILIAHTHQKDTSITTSDLAKLLNASATTTSRIVYYLGEGIPASGIKGLNLVELKLDTTDRRRRSAHLTKTGQVVVQRILQTIA